MSEASPTAVPPQVPFRGIEPYRYVDHPIFFARDDDAHGVLRAVTMYRGVLLYGESGAGKSSMINAGFIPIATAQRFAACRIRVRPIPGEELQVERLSVAGDARPPYVPAPLFDGDDEAPTRALSARALPEQIPEEAERRPLLIFDQFEEFVTLFEPGSATDAQAASKAREAIVDTLITLLQSESLRVKVLFVFREDYLAKLNPFFALTRDLASQYLRLVPPAVEALHSIIRGPFEKFPDRYQPELTDELATAIIAAVTKEGRAGTVNLSELQIACLRLWRSSHPDELFAQRGIQGLLEDYLSDALDLLPTELYEPTVAVLARMVTRADTRNVISDEDLLNRLESEVGIAPELTRRALEVLADEAKLVRRERRHDVYFYELVSEYLVPWISRRRTEGEAAAKEQQLREQVERRRIQERDRAAVRRTAFDEREYAAAVEAADADEFAQMLLQADEQEQRVLAMYLGERRFGRLHELALRRSVSRADRGDPDDVVVFIHDFLGSRLEVTTTGGISSPAWPSAASLRGGGLQALRLAPDGRTSDPPGTTARATGVLKRFHGELLLRLSASHVVRAFAYDWRQDLQTSAAELAERMRTWTSSKSRVHVVAHGMGGLVARAFLVAYPTAWTRPSDKLLMIGTPSHGMAAALELLTGTYELSRRLSILCDASGSQVREVLATFPALYQLLPSPSVAPWLYEGGPRVPLVSRRHLDTARVTHEVLESVVDIERMALILGSGHPTPEVAGVVVSGARPSDPSGREPGKAPSTLAGDGLVPHALAALGDSRGAVPAYYVDGDHADLLGDDAVIDGIEALLVGTEPELPLNPPPHTRPSRKIDASGRKRLGALAGRLPAQAIGVPFDGPLTLDELTSEDLLTEGWLARRAEILPAGPSPRDLPRAPTLRVEVVAGDVASVSAPRAATFPVDAIAVGHYAGRLPPNASAAALDHEITDVGRRSRASMGAGEGVLSRLMLSGVITGAFPEVFLLPDPRDNAPAHDSRARVIAVAGMGLPGRFGSAELTVLARTLCWTLAVLGHRHLATVLIGSGQGGLTVQDAVAAWMRGAAAAGAGDRALEQLTFVERDPSRVLELEEAVATQQRRCSEDGSLEIDYAPLSPADRARVAKAVDRQILNERKRQQAGEPLRRAAPVRATIARVARGYAFGIAGAGTREMPIDSALVRAAVDELVASSDLDGIRSRGEFLARLLIPADLKPLLMGGEPVVLYLDDDTSWIPWELVASSRSQHVPPETSPFLGLRTSVTRQLVTAARRPPEPPPERRRVLRVLIVADPAVDARLAGAEEEGLLVSDIVSGWGSSRAKRQIEVVALIGPRRATRTEVLRLLLLESFDIVHFAGHVVRIASEAERWGWLFSGGEVLAASELRRVDRAPSLVVSNAVQAGATPDQPARHSIAGAGGIAAGLHAAGVLNVVAPAWPVDDRAARVFAQSLYPALLGMATGRQDPDAADGPLPLHAAVTAARRAVAELPYGAPSWAAYQHYGDPFFRAVPG